MSRGLGDVYKRQLDPLVKLRTDINGLAVESCGLDRLQEEALIVGDFSR